MVVLPGLEDERNGCCQINVVTMHGGVSHPQHRDAAKLVYLGLSAAARGQESAGPLRFRTSRPLEGNIAKNAARTGAGEQIIAPGTQQIHVGGMVTRDISAERLSRLHEMPRSVTSATRPPRIEL